MFLPSIVDAITWCDGTHMMREVHEGYDRLLEYALEVFVDRVSNVEPRLAAELKEIAEAASIAERRTVLVAPESSFRLLWPGLNEVCESATFLASALSTERWRDRDDHPFSDDMWTAAGDAFLRGGGGHWTTRDRSSGLSLDLGSPHAAKVDVDGRRARLLEPLTSLRSEDLERAVKRIKSAVSGITRVNSDIAWFVARFTKSLIPLPDRANPTQFSSGSSGQFVGRTVLGNPHLDSVTTARMADALVHEAMHTLLYMDEQQDPWVLRPDLYDGPLRIRSPWTGTSLPLRPYLQACFIWFGLLNFWSRAGSTSAFPVAETRERLSQALIGFLRGPLLERVASVAQDLSSELISSIDEIQRSVVKAWGDTTTVAAREAEV